MARRHATRRLVVAVLGAVLALAAVGCGGDDAGDDQEGTANTTLGSAADAFPAEEQAVRAYLGDEGREPQAILCSPKGENAVCSVTFDDGTCERYEVASGARTVVKSEDAGGECPEQEREQDAEDG